MFPLSAFRPKTPPPPPTSSPITATIITGNPLWHCLKVEFPLAHHLAPDLATPDKVPSRFVASAMPGFLRRPAAGLLPWVRHRQEPVPPDYAISAPWLGGCYRNRKPPDAGRIDPIPDRNLRLSGLELAQIQAGELRPSWEAMDPGSPGEQHRSYSLQKSRNIEGRSQSKAAAFLQIWIWDLGLLGKWCNKALDFSEKTILAPWSFLVPAFFGGCNLAPASLNLISEQLNRKRRRGAAKTKTTEDAENGVLGRA